jgi:HEAT repeat protein
VVRALGRLRDARAVLPLVGRLQDAAPEVRRAAARSLRELGDPRAGSALVVALADASTQVRLEAIEALGALRATEAVLALAPLATGGTGAPSVSSAPPPRGESSEVVRAAALRALARIGDGRAIAAVVSALPLDDPDAADLARAASSSAGPGRSVMLAAGPTAPSPTAAAPLGSATPAGDALVLAGKASVPALLDVLRGAAGPRATSSAARALAVIDPAAAAPAIGRAMVAGALPVRAGLAALARTESSEALPLVLERLDDAEPLVRREALAAALALLDPSRPDGRVVDPAAAALRDARRPLDERVGLVRLLGRSGSPRAHAALLALVAPTSARDAVGPGRTSPQLAADEARRAPVRIAALEALGALALPSAGADRALLAAIDDDDAAVRRAASAALARAGSPASVTEIARRLTEAAEQDRAALAIALSGVASRVRSEESGEALAEALDRAPTDVRDGVLEALGRSGGEAVREALLGAARAPDADDRRKASEALAGHATAPDARAALRALAGDGDAGVRAAALWALGRAGEASDLQRLGKAMADPDAAASANATAALARVAARAGAGATIAPRLCAALDDKRAYVVVNALAGVRLLGGSCPVERIEPLLAPRRPAVVRRAAAQHLRRVVRSGGDAAPRATSLLARCAADERDAEVADTCADARRPAAGPAAPPAPSRDLVIFVVSDGSQEPRARAPFAVARPDGFVRAGLADRRGAVLERDLGPGEVRLEVPAPLLR